MSEPSEGSEVVTMADAKPAGKVFTVDKSKLPGRKPKTVIPATRTLAQAGLSAINNTDPSLPTYVKRLNLLLYGPPGSSKTVTAHSLPNTRTLDLDDGMQSVEWAIRKGIIDKEMSEIVYRTILPDPNDPKSTIVIDTCSDTLDEWLADEDIPPEQWDRPYPQFWDTLIIDSGSALTDASIIKALNENKRLKSSQSLDLMVGKLGITPMRTQDWGGAGSVFQKFINMARSAGKNVVLICHEYVDKDEDTGAILSIDPLLIGQLRQKMAKDFDEVWYAHVTGSRTEPEYKLQTTPDPKRRLRSRSGCLEPVEKNDFMAIKNKIAKFYGVDPSRLWVASHGTAAVMEEMTRAAEGPASI